MGFSRSFLSPSSLSPRSLSLFIFLCCCSAFSVCVTFCLVPFLVPFCLSMHFFFSLALFPHSWNARLARGLKALQSLRFYIPFETSYFSSLDVFEHFTFFFFVRLIAIALILLLILLMLLQLHLHKIFNGKHVYIYIWTPNTFIQWQCDITKTLVACIQLISLITVKAANNVSWCLHEKSQC